MCDQRGTTVGVEGAVLRAPAGGPDKERATVAPATLATSAGRGNAMVATASATPACCGAGVSAAATRAGSAPPGAVPVTTSPTATSARASKGSGRVATPSRPDAPTLPGAPRRPRAGDRAAEK